MKRKDTLVLECFNSFGVRKEEESVNTYQLRNIKEKGTNFARQVKAKWEPSWCTSRSPNPVSVRFGLWKGEERFSLLVQDLHPYWIRCCHGMSHFCFIVIKTVFVFRSLNWLPKCSWIWYSKRSSISWLFNIILVGNQTGIKRNWSVYQVIFCCL